jgi:hypothetical protein
MRKERRTRRYKLSRMKELYNAAMPSVKSVAVVQQRSQLANAWHAHIMTPPAKPRVEIAYGALNGPMTSVVICAAVERTGLAR